MVLLVLFGNLGILYERYSFGLPFDAQIGNLFGFELNGELFGVSARTLLTGFVAGLLGLALSEGAYGRDRACRYRIDQSGQAEAASALGMSRPLTMRRIVLAGP